MIFTEMPFISCQLQYKLLGEVSILWTLKTEECLHNGFGSSEIHVLWSDLTARLAAGDDFGGFKMRENF